MKQVLELVDLGDAIQETKQYFPGGYIIDNVGAYGYG